MKLYIQEKQVQSVNEVSARYVWSVVCISCAVGLAILVKPCPAVLKSNQKTVFLMCFGFVVSPGKPRVPYCEEWPGAAHSRGDQECVAVAVSPGKPQVPGRLCRIALLPAKGQCSREHYCCNRERLCTGSSALEILHCSELSACRLTSRVQTSSTRWSPPVSCSVPRCKTRLRQ